MHCSGPHFKFLEAYEHTLYPTCSNVCMIAHCYLLSSACVWCTTKHFFKPSDFHFILFHLFSYLSILEKKTLKGRIIQSQENSIQFQSTLVYKKTLAVQCLWHKYVYWHRSIVHVYVLRRHLSWWPYLKRTIACQQGKSTLLHYMLTKIIRAIHTCIGLN